MILFAIEPKHARPRPTRPTLRVNEGPIPAPRQQTPPVTKRRIPTLVTQVGHRRPKTRLPRQLRAVYELHSPGRLPSCQFHNASSRYCRVQLRSASRSVSAIAWWESPTSVISLPTHAVNPSLPLRRSINALLQGKSTAR